MPVATEPIHSAVAAFLTNTPKKLLIGGKWVESASGETFEVLNPSDESVLARVQKGSAEDINRAVKAARKAFDSGVYSRMSVHARSKLMFKLAEALHNYTQVKSVWVRT